ncbi:MAG: hypothetical protein KKF67_01820 [Nanoarchaeota archaeon]|nr:hypothetical protein [Nanoarchaeota archaeon]
MENTGYRFTKDERLAITNREGVSVLAHLITKLGNEGIKIREPKGEKIRYIKTREGVLIAPIEKDFTWGSKNYRVEKDIRAYLN